MKSRDTKLIWVNLTILNVKSKENKTLSTLRQWDQRLHRICFKNTSSI